MEIIIKVVTLTVVCYGFYKWLTFRRKRVKAQISPGILGGKPVLYCDIGNYFGDKPIIVTDCHLVVDGQLSQLAVSTPSVSLPRTVQVREGIVVHFDPIPLVTKAREKRQNDFKVRALFHDSAGRAYLSKPITIQTDQRHFIRLFEDQMEHRSEPAKKVLNMAQEITEQLNQQLVGIPHIVLALLRERDGVGGHVLRELGLSEEFLLNLAKYSPNLPRDRGLPQPYLSMEVEQLVHEFMRDEARKMRQRCFGTGHLLLGLTKQENEMFLTMLKHLEIQPRQLRIRIHEVLRKDQNPTDHPTLPPEGIKRYIWAIWYQFTHALLIVLVRVIYWLFPDTDF